MRPRYTLTEAKKLETLGYVERQDDKKRNRKDEIKQETI